MAVKLTDRKILSMKPGPGERLEIADTQVPGLRVRATLARGIARPTFYFRYNHRETGKKVSIRIGGYPATSLRAAREKALAARAELDAGLDPKESRERRRQAEQSDAAYTVADLAKEFLSYAERHRAPKTVADYRRYLDRLVAAWRDRDARAIRRGDVVEVLDEASERGYRSAGHLLAAGRAAWSFALERERVEFNPWAGLKRQTRAYKAKTRTRALTDRELREFLLSLPTCPLPPAPRLALQLILWAACRPGEACGAQWQELDLEAAVWSLPAQRTKSRKDHTVMLATQTVAALRAHKMSLGRGRHRYLFPAGSQLGHHSPTFLDKQLRTALTSGELDIEPFRPHDLRRTVATGLARLGAPREVIKRVLGHVDSDVTSIYQRHRYDKEGREWLQRWADHLDALVAPNVLPLERGVGA